MREPVSRLDPADSGPNPHLDEVWELEMSELARRIAPKDRREQGLIKHLHRLHSRYAPGQTPRDLPAPKLHAHAASLDHRFERICAHVEHLVSPGVAKSAKLKHYLRENMETEVYYQSLVGWQQKILAEMQTVCRYWHWVRKHRKLPHRHFPRGLRPYNDLPIVHPFQHVRPETPEAAARIERELRH